MRFRLHLLTTIVLLGLTSVPLGARGADLVIVSNLNEPHSLYDTILPFTTGGSPGFAAAQEFKTGPNDYKLAQILVIGESRSREQQRVHAFGDPAGGQ